MSTERRAAWSLYMKGRRTRNKAAGLCHCGNDRRTDPLTGLKKKTCEVCHARAGGVARLKQGYPAVAIRTPQAFPRLVVDVHGEELARWEEFAVEFDIPLAQCVSDAMELYMAVTRRHEPEHPKPVIEEGREAYA